MRNSKEDSDVKVGDLLTIEGGLGKSWAEGSLSLDLTDFAQRKITSDDLGGNPPSPNKHRIFGAGPDLVLPLASEDRYYGSVSLRYLFDFGVESNTEGNSLILMATLPIPSSPLQ